MGELPFAAVVRAGVVLLVLSAIAALSFPQSVGPLPKGFSTPILAFELARTRAEVETMFGPEGSSERIRYKRALDRGNAVDFALLLAYGSLLSLFARALGQRSKGR